MGIILILSGIHTYQRGEGSASVQEQSKQSEKTITGAQGNKELKENAKNVSKEEIQDSKNDGDSNENQELNLDPNTSQEEMEKKDKEKTNKQGGASGIFSLFGGKGSLEKAVYGQQEHVRQYGADQKPIDYYGEEYDGAIRICLKGSNKLFLKTTDFYGMLSAMYLYDDNEEVAVSYGSESVTVYRNGKPVTKTDQYGNKDTWEYDNNMNLLKHTSDQGYMITVTECTVENNKCMHDYTTEDGLLTEEHDYTYDANGFLTDTIEHTLYYNVDHTELRSEYWSHYYYTNDYNGNPIEIVQIYDGDRTTAMHRFYTYHPNGEKASFKNCDSSIEHPSQEWTYDEKGRVILSIENTSASLSNDWHCTKIIKEYDDQDRLVKYEEYYDDFLRHGEEYTYKDLPEETVKEILEGAKQLVKGYPIVENANVSKMYRDYVNDGR